MQVKQLTFYGEDRDTRAIEWLLNLSKCFQIRKAIIKKNPRKFNDWTEDRWVVKVWY